MTKPKDDLTMEDEEFLMDISTLTEARRNGIIAYLKNRCESVRQQTAQEYRQDIKEMLIVLEALTPKKTEGYKKLTEWKQKYLKGGDANDRHKRIG